MEDSGTTLTKEIYCEPLDLIDAVKNRPVLWDRNHEEFKIKKARDRAWIEVAGLVTTGFDTKNQDEKTLVVKSLQDRWRHIKDAFFRTIKKKAPYIYQVELQFLEAKYHEYQEAAKNAPPKEPGSCKKCKCVKTEGSPPPRAPTPPTTTAPVKSASTSKKKTKTRSSRRNKAKKIEDDTDSDYEESENFTISEPDPPSYTTRKQKALSESMAAQNGVVIEEEETVNKNGVSFSTAGGSFFNERDEDELFFASILSSVKNMSNEKKIEFRIGVLSLIQEILR